MTTINYDEMIPYMDQFHARIGTTLKARGWKIDSDDDLPQSITSITIRHLAKAHGNGLSPIVAAERVVAAFLAANGDRDTTDDVLAVLAAS